MRDGPPDFYVGVREVATDSQLRERREEKGMEGLEAEGEGIGSHNPFLSVIPAAFAQI